MIRQKLLKAIVYLTILLIVILAFGKYYTNHLKSKSLPDYNKNIKIPGLKHKVTVYRDKLGIPHIYAENQHDLYMATGYIHSQDRLWQMDLLRRVTKGELSEIFGKKLVNIDLMFRAARITEKSKMIIKRSDKKILDALKAYSEGVNSYIKEHSDNLPIEFTILGYKPDKWKPLDTINLVGYMGWDLTSPWRIELVYYKILQEVGEKRFKELIPNVKNTPTSIYSQIKSTDIDGTRFTLLDDLDILRNKVPSVFSASNNWAVSGKKSITGKPLLANDMHLGLSIPGIWYQMHQNITPINEKYNNENTTAEFEENRLNVTGVMVAGSPFIVAGHNGKIAWGMTNVMIDDMDFFIEKINPKNKNQYQYMGKWKNFKISKEIIKIKGGESVEKELRYSIHGPIISEFKHIKDKQLSMHWVGNYYSNELRTLYLLNRANNYEGFKTAITTFSALSQNIVYADTKGNIALYCAAGIPIRKKGDGMLPVPGWTDEYEWNGFVPFEKLPHTFNPKNGILASANNKTTGNDYPYHISYWYYLPRRYNRIMEMLKAKERHSVKDFMDIQNDKKSLKVKTFLPKLINTLKSADNLNETEKLALKQLINWDQVMNKDAPEPMIFDQFYVILFKNTFKDELDEETFNKFFHKRGTSEYVMEQLWQKNNSRWFDDITTKNRVETQKDIIIKSFKETIDLLHKKFGNKVANWKWGDLHTFTLVHPLGKNKLLENIFNFNRGPYNLGGSYHTVCAYNYDPEKSFKVNDGPSERHVFNTNNWDRSYTVIPTGESGQPGSPFYCNQTKLYVKGQYHHDYFTKKPVVKHAVYKMNFLP